MKYSLFRKPEKLISLLLVLVLFTGIQSCIKDKFDFNRMAQVEWEPTVAGPIMHTTLTLWDVLYDWDSSHLFVQDETNFLTLLYRGTIFSQTAEQLITIPNQTYPAFNSGSFPSPGSGNYEIVIPLSFTVPTGQHLDEIIFKQGTWNLNLTTNFNTPATNLVIEFPSIKRVDNNEILSFPHSNIGIGQQQINDTKEMNGYKAAFSHPTPSANNLNVNIRITFQTPGVLGNSLVFNSTLNNIRFSKLIGYFGQPSFVIKEDTIFLDVFKRSLGGRFTLKEPELNIYVYNSYGFPININFDKFAAFRNVPPYDSVNITGSGFPNPWVINAPTNPSFPTTIKSTLNLNKTTCNIDQAINICPQNIIYQTRGTGNPSGDTSKINFVLDTSNFKVDVDVKLPIWGRAINFTVQDTFKIAEFNLENRDKIDWAAIRVTSTNGFPVDVNMQIYFVDTLVTPFKVVDSLYLKGDDSQLIRSGVLGPGPDYRVIMPYIKKSETIISGDRVNYMIDNKVTKILVRAIFNTKDNNGTDVKFYSDYSLDIKIGAKTHVKLKY
jgi:hypothetical protein